MRDVMQPPRRYRIDDRMLEPRFFSGQKPEAPIDDRGKFCGQIILDDDAPPVGTVMRFAWHYFDGERHASGSIVVLDELLAYEKWREQQAQEASEAERWRDLVDRAIQENESRDFNAALAVPVRWQPASKVALNALYERNGSGARSNSVEHIQVLEPLAIGRIKREPKALLCGAKPGSEGLSTTGPYWFSKPGDPVYRVTCASCLRIAARFKKPGA